MGRLRAAGPQVLIRMHMSKSSRIHFAVAGLGWPGRMHSAAVLGARGAVLHAVVDANADRLKEFMSEFPVKIGHTDYDAALADPKIDAVILCLPNFLHFPASMGALRAGKHVLCEKPPTLTAREMRRLKLEAESRGLIYAFGRQMRFGGRMMAARKLVRAGKLGDVYYARTSWLRKRGIPIGMGGWFLDRKRAGGGALIDIGIHALDNAWYLMGSPRPVAVSGRVFQKFDGLVPGNVHNDVDDCGFAFIRFEGGQVLSLETTWAANLPETMAEGWNGSADCVLFGSKASLQYQPLRLFEGDGEHVRVREVIAGKTDEFQLQLKDLMRAIRTGNAPVSNATHALWLMQMLDAVYQSSQTGREVRIRTLG